MVWKTCHFSHTVRLYPGICRSYFVHTSTNTLTALLIYVDDIILACNSIIEITRIKHMLDSTFKIKDLCKLKYLSLVLKLLTLILIRLYVKGNNVWTHLMTLVFLALYLSLLLWTLLSSCIMMGDNYMKIFIPIVGL